MYVRNQLGDYYYGNDVWDQKDPDKQRGVSYNLHEVKLLGDKLPWPALSMVNRETGEVVFDALEDKAMQLMFCF